MEIVFATHNKNKLNEVQQLIPSTIQLLSLTDIGCTEEILETATTLKGNAILKANYVTKTYGYHCFADDTGLEVQVLNNAPGVYSARYAGASANATLNMRKLLHNLRNETNRAAQFKTVVVLNLDGNQQVFEGVCKGCILSVKKGVKGFGYDPIFQPNGFNKSFAEMSLEEKGRISHRGKAIAGLVTYLSGLPQSNS